MKSRRKCDKEQKSSERFALIGCQSLELEHFQLLFASLLLLRRRTVRARTAVCVCVCELERQRRRQRWDSPPPPVAWLGGRRRWRRCRFQRSSKGASIMRVSLSRSLAGTATAQCRPTRALECLCCWFGLRPEQRHSYRSALVPVVSNHPQPVRVRTYIGEHLERVTVAFAFVVAVISRHRRRWHFRFCVCVLRASEFVFVFCACVYLCIPVSISVSVTVCVRVCVCECGGR